MSVELKTTGKQDPVLKTVLDMVERAVGTFVEAIPAMEFGLRFKAFSVRKFEDDEKGEKWEAFKDLLEAATIRALEDHRDLVREYEMDMATTEDDTDHHVWLYARKKVVEEDEEHEEESE